MRKIVGPRGSGKTKELMKLAKEENAVFVCYNPYHMKEKAERYGIIGLTFISYSDFLREPIGEKFVIDELEMLISTTHFFGKCVGFSYTEE